MLSGGLFVQGSFLRLVSTAGARPIDFPGTAWMLLMRAGAWISCCRVWLNMVRQMVFGVQPKLSTLCLGTVQATYVLSSVHGSSTRMQLSQNHTRYRLRKSPFSIIQPVELYHCSHPYLGDLLGSPKAGSCITHLPPPIFPFAGLHG